MCIERRVQEADRLLAGLDPLLVDARDDARDDWRRRAGAGLGDELAVHGLQHVVAGRGHVREGAAGAVVDAAAAADGLRARVVAGEGRRVRAQVAVDRGRLPLRPRDTVREAAARGHLHEGGGAVVLGLEHRHLLQERAVRRRLQRGAADGRHVGAGGEAGRVEEVVVRAGAVLDAGPGAVGDAHVARRDQHAGALQPELHELGAEPLLLALGPREFAVGDRDRQHVGPLVRAALDPAAVRPRHLAVRAVDGLERRLDDGHRDGRLTLDDLRGVRGVVGIGKPRHFEEIVEEEARVEERNVLRIDERPGHLMVQVGLEDPDVLLVRAVGRHQVRDGAIEKHVVRVGPRRNLGIGVGKEQVHVRLDVRRVPVDNAHLVPRLGLSRFGHLVQRLDARRRHHFTARRGIEGSDFLRSVGIRGQFAFSQCLGWWCALLSS